MSDLRGVYPPIPTPFRGDVLAVDFERLEAHVRWLQQEGVDGILVLGTTGEFASLSFAERLQVVRFVLERRGSLEVLVNASATNQPEVLDLARAAAEAGAKAVLVMPPFYFRDAPRAGFLEFYRRILDASPLPVLLYHFPARSGVDLGREAVAELAAHPKLAGVKDSGAKIESVLEFLEHPRLRVFVGNDHLVEEGIARGASGVISACSNIVPGLVRHIVAAATRGGEPDELQKALSQIRLLVDKHGGLAAVKALLEVRGLGRGAVRPPLVTLAEDARGGLRAAYDSIVSTLRDGR